MDGDKKPREAADADAAAYAEAYAEEYAKTYALALADAYGEARAAARAAARADARARAYDAVSVSRAVYAESRGEYDAARAARGKRLT